MNKRITVQDLIAILLEVGQRHSALDLPIYVDADGDANGGTVHQAFEVLLMSKSGTQFVCISKGGLGESMAAREAEKAISIAETKARASTTPLNDPEF